MIYLLYLVIIAILVGIDQLTKMQIAAFVDANGPVEFLFGLFRLTYVENTGVAFSMFSGKTDVLSVITAIILAGSLCALFIRRNGRKKPVFLVISLILINAGGIGNLIDRVFNGFVIDFIEPLFIDFAVFNFADCCITVGAFLLLGYEIYDIVKDMKAKKQ